ncbi:MAG: hypothetical protein RLZZ385_1438 [Pseudomonadota bacterium]|jgi:hypothetical protein
MITVVIPYHLQTLARTGPEVKLAVAGTPTARTLIQALEQKHPTLRGAILDQGTGQRRPKIRFFACKQDISHDSMDKPLPQEVIDGQEPLLIVGAISGG